MTFVTIFVILYGIGLGDYKLYHFGLDLNINNNSYFLSQSYYLG